VDIVVLTGAGISRGSGLATFRDRDGLWAKYDFERLATPEAFAEEPDLVHEFYNLRRRQAIAAMPNAAHHALVVLEEDLAGRGGTLTVITQNVDDLHSRAGTRTLLTMHGQLTRAWCLLCDDRMGWSGDLSVDDRCTLCGRQGGLRPDIVWFGEVPYHLDEIDRALENADLFAAIGTSGHVYPAAGLVSAAKRRGIKTVEMNLEPSANAGLFDQAIYGPANDVVPAWVATLMTKA